MRKKKLSPVADLLERVNKNTTGIFKRDSELIVTLPAIIANIIKSNRIYLSEFIITKVKGRIKGLNGHPKITDSIFLQLPYNLSNPYKIIQETRKSNKKEYLFLNLNPFHQIIVEIERYPSGLTEINTIFESTLSELKRLEDKLPTVFSSGETPISRIHASR